MRRRIQIYAGVLLLLNTQFLAAQRVLYSPYIVNRSVTRFEVAGKAGDYYWIQKEKSKRNVKRNADPWLNAEQSFDIYDTRMNLVNDVPPFMVSDNTLKEYFVPGNRYFDQLILSAEYKKTNLVIERYEADGRLVSNGKIIGSFPFNETGNSFLLIRSEDQTKILLLGFESVPDSPPRLHAILFDQNWNQLFNTVYDHPFITQPLIQDDFFSYPIDHFSSAPVKLANNGQWLMESPSRTNRNFLLFHFRGTDSSFSYKEIKLPPSSNMEDVALSIDNNKGEAFAGVLSKFRYTALKNVQVTHYSLMQETFDFDSSYRFNTLVSGKAKSENLTNESFIAVPGLGFMLLKEYGRIFTDSYDDAYNNQWDPELIFANNVATNTGLNFSMNKDGYTRYSTFGGIRNTYDRGDLSLFYFPAYKKDSCWSGIINKEQLTELNSPYLSYLVVPVKEKLFFLYNSFLRNEDQYGSTTILDQQGHQLSDGGAIFWKFNNTLNFQKARQISENEVAIPYENYQRKGFAIIRF